MISSPSHTYEYIMKNNTFLVILTDILLFLLIGCLLRGNKEEKNISIFRDNYVSII